MSVRSENERSFWCINVWEERIDGCLVDHEWVNSR